MRDAAGWTEDDYHEARLEAQWHRRAQNAYCIVCMTRGGHATGCPETPDDLDEECVMM
jgi:hypothetical protein